MQEQDNPTPEPIKPDLKHDNLEYAASTEGDDVLDMDKESIQQIEDEEITAEELDQLEEDDADSQAAALHTAETDSQADEDNFLTETNTEEAFGDEDADEEKEIRR